MGDDPEAVVLELVQPSVAARNGRGQHRLTGADEARRLAPVPGKRGKRINM